MAEAKSSDEPTFPAKRKPDEEETLPLKSQKLHKEGTKEGKHSDIAIPQSIPEDEELVIGAEEEDDDDVDEDFETDGDDDEDEDEDDDEEEENGNVVVDRKGKGILVEEEKDSEDDDDDSSDGGNETGGESDLSDDPLNEVDLNNILPSRTRRRVVQPGVYIAKDAGNNGGGDDSD